MKHADETAKVVRIAKSYLVVGIIAAGLGALLYAWGYAQSVHAHRRCVHPHYLLPPSSPSPAQKK